MKINKFYFLFLIVFLFFSGCRDDFKVKREARGIWMSRFDYTRRNNNPEDIKNTILISLQNAKKARFNMIIFQIRGNADAFYKSDYEPWSQLLTGKLGEDPGFDPLGFAIEIAHSLGLELHVWINAFPAWKAQDKMPIESTPRHVLLEHPDWVVCDKGGKPMNPKEGYISLSPGIPEVREHLVKVVMDIVRKYDIDGVHFDYIRYPEGSNKLGYSHDPVSVKRYNSPEGNPKNLDWENWQRDQVCEFIRNVYDSVTNVKPWVKMSASAIGNYKRTGWNGYYVVYQDPKKWMEESKVDFIVPMIYQPRNHPTSPFEGTIKEWGTMLNLKNIYPGLGAYRAAGEKGWGWNEIWEEIKLLREAGFPGMVFFAMSNLFTVWDDIKTTQFPFYANVPSFSHKVKEKPDKPINLIAERLPDNRIILKWQKVKNDKYNQPHYYNIYRSESEKINFETSECLINITCLNETQYIDEKIGSANYYYSVSALNRSNIEGEHSEIIKAVRTGISKK